MSTNTGATQGLSPAAQATVTLIRRIACVTATVYMCSFWTASTRTELFQYHPLAMTAAFLSAMPEAVSLGGAIRRSKSMNERKATSQFHLAVSICMSLLTFAGYLVIYINKTQRSKPHLTSWHGLIGFVTVTLVLLQAALGITAYFRLASNNVLPVVRRAHKFCGAGVLLLGSGSMWLGLQSHFANGAVISPVVRLCFGLAVAIASVLAFLIE